MPDVAPVLSALEVNVPYGLIRFVERAGQVVAQGGDAEDAPARRYDPPGVAPAGSGVKNDDVAHRFSGVEAGDGQAFSVGSRIPARGHHDAGGSAGTRLKRHVAQPSGGARRSTQKWI